VSHLPGILCSRKITEYGIENIECRIEGKINFSVRDWQKKIESAGAARIIFLSRERATAQVSGQRSSDHLLVGSQPANTLRRGR